MTMAGTSSPCLFQNDDKSPMVFCLRPCQMKKEVKEHIVEGGGLCFQNFVKVPPEYKSNVTLLIPNGETSFEPNALLASYIIDCANEGKLLSRDNYRCLPEVDQEKEGFGGRTPYSKTEDVNILLHVRDHGSKAKNRLTGNTFWKQLEDLNMFQLRGRSWQSLKDRYLKHLKGREAEYPLDGRFIGPLPMPPEDLPNALFEEQRQNEIPKGKQNAGNESSSPKSSTSKKAAGTFLAEVEGRRNNLSPGLSRKEYHVLVNDFVTSMEKATNLNSKVIHKVLFKCNGNEETAKHYLLHGECPEGFHMFTDDEDKVLLKCLLNPTICDELPAKKLADKLGGEVVLDRSAALIGVSRSDFEYMQSIPLHNPKLV